MTIFLTVVYWLSLAFFLGGFTVVVYHLWFYRVNDRVSLFTIMFFMAGFIILIFLNIFFAAKVDLEQYNFIF